MTNQLTAFIIQKDKIDQLLAKLVSHSADHFGENPDSVNWADVGSLEYVREQLENIANFMGIKE